MIFWTKWTEYGGLQWKGSCRIYWVWPLWIQSKNCRRFRNTSSNLWDFLNARDVKLDSILFQTWKHISVKCTKHIYIILTLSTVSLTGRIENKWLKVATQLIYNRNSNGQIVYINICFKIWFVSCQFDLPNLEVYQFVYLSN